METQTITPRIISIISLYDMHTNFFHRVLDGINDSDSHKRLDTKANHIAWLAGSLVQERYDLAKELGIHEQQTAHDLFDNHKGIQEGVTYPSLADYKRDWDKISPLLKEALTNISDEKLDSPFEMMPGQSFPFYELVTFLTYREANCIGQIALWRRLLGYDAMKYD